MRLEDQVNHRFGEISLEEAILQRTEEVYELYELGELELDPAAENFLIETADRKGIML